MTSSIPTVFITGATGSQGFSLAKQLRALHWSVHTTTRNLEAPGVAALAAAGVQVGAGDWDDLEALRASMAGCSKLFLCLMPDPSDIDHERRQAETIVRAARAAGVSQVVSSTSLGVSMYPDDARLRPGTLLYPLLEVKKKVEGVVERAGFDAVTYLRPAYFMANFLEPMINMFTDILGPEADWRSALTPETRLGLVDHDDIAKFAVAAFKEPEKWNGRVVGIASELLSPQETMDALGEAMGRPLKASFLSDEGIAALPYGPIVMAKCDKSMRYMPEYVDMEELAGVARLTSFREFLEREKGGVKKL